MRKFKVLYSDKTFSDRPDRYETKPYTRDIAQELADMLGMMGCTDFEFVPVTDEVERKAA